MFFLANRFYLNRDDTVRMIEKKIIICLTSLEIDLARYKIHRENLRIISRYLFIVK